VNIFLDVHVLHHLGVAAVERELLNAYDLVKSKVQGVGLTHNIEIEVDCQKKLQIYVDPKAFERILGNLLDNAVKHGAADSPIYVKLEGKEKKVFLSVQNYGETIPEEERQGIFDIFHKGGATFSGHGIGLSVVKALAEAHQGSVWVESANEVTTFTVAFPDKEA
jgi:signal transduction histidine kinase